MTHENDETDRLWAALGDPMRLRLLNLLLESDEATLARTLPITRQGVAKHLTVLERAGLVKARRAGREVRFTVRDDRLDQARQQIAQIASRWDERLAAIKQIAEETHKPTRPHDNRNR
jgi:DNA-binding transcriptional ArsR family regulator